MKKQCFRCTSWFLLTVSIFFVSCKEKETAEENQELFLGFNKIKTGEQLAERKAKCHKISSKTNCKYFTFGCVWVDEGVWTVGENGELQKTHCVVSLCCEVQRYRGGSDNRSEYAQRKEFMQRLLWSVF